MIKMTQKEVNEAIRLHGLWLKDKTTGERADFSGKDLSGLKFRGANLNGAYLSDANLRNVGLRLAYFSNANLRCANLRG